MTRRSHHARRAGLWLLAGCVALLVLVVSGPAVAKHHALKPHKLWHQYPLRVHIRGKRIRPRRPSRAPNASVKASQHDAAGGDSNSSSTNVGAWLTLVGGVVLMTIGLVVIKRMQSSTGGGPAPARSEPGPPSESSKQPVLVPSGESSKQPVAVPSEEGSKQPVVAPSGESSKQPAVAPSGESSKQPVVARSGESSKQPVVARSGESSKQPVVARSGESSKQPVVARSGETSKQPVVARSGESSKQPVVARSGETSKQPVAVPSEEGSKLPGVAPSGESSKQPVVARSGESSKQPAVTPSGESSKQAVVARSGEGSKPVAVPSGEKGSKQPEPSSGEGPKQPVPDLVPPDPISPERDAAPAPEHVRLKLADGRSLEGYKRHSASTGTHLLILDILAAFDQDGNAAPTKPSDSFILESEISSIQRVEDS